MMVLDTTQPVMKLVPQSSSAAAVRRASPAPVRHVMQPVPVSSKKTNPHVLGKENSSAQINCPESRHRHVVDSSHHYGLKKQPANENGKESIANSSSVHGLKQLNGSRIVAGSKRSGNSVNSTLNKVDNNTTNSNQVKSKRGVGS